MDYINEIKEKVKYLANNTSYSSKVHVAPDITKKTLENVEKSARGQLSKNHVIAILDTSFLGKGKEGIYFTEEKLVIKEMLEKPVELYFSDMKNVEIGVRSKGNKDKDYNIINMKDTTTYLITETFSKYINASSFSNLMNSILNENIEFKKPKKIVPLEELSEEVKLIYVKILCNYAYSNDDIIDSKEYAEIISFIVRIKFSQEMRLDLRSYMATEDKSKLEDTMSLINELIEECGNIEQKLIFQSLMKDIISICMLNSESKEYEKDEFIFTLAKKLDITKEEIGVFVTSYIHDKAIIEKRLNDTDIKKTIKDLSSKAASVGIPMSALYLSGTAGVSAVGMSSGLATLGMGGILGFSSMFTGVGVLALLGITSYQGIKKISGINNEKNNKQREIMLQEIVKNNQMSLQILIEDVNSISEKLMTEIKKGEENSIKLQKLAQILRSVTEGSKEVVNRVDHYESENILTKVPQKLRKERLEGLVNSEEEEVLKEKVLECYYTDDNSNLVLKYNISKKIADELFASLETLGYFKLSDNATATAKGLLLNIRN